MVGQRPTKAIFNVKPQIGAIVYVAFVPLWISCSFMVWYLMEFTKRYLDSSFATTYKSVIDTIQWWFHVGIWGQLVLFFTLAITIDTAIMRRLYWYSTLLSLSGPFLGYWAAAVWYIVEAGQNGIDFYGTRGRIFIVVKIFMVFVYSLASFLVSWEFMWPILEWWQKLEQLAKFEKYVRPTEQEVIDGDYKVIVDEDEFFLADLNLIDM